MGPQFPNSLGAEIDKVGHPYIRGNNLDQALPDSGSWARRNDQRPGGNGGKTYQYEETGYPKGS